MQIDGHHAFTYVAARGVSDESGAVQRLLNRRRIASIKHFTLQGGDYPGAIVLNWTSKTSPFTVRDENLEIPLARDLAQIIDGQHRIAGIHAAIDENPNLRSLEVPVAIYHGLSTRECADIFISINTEQKQVPRSLVFDLYGEASEKTIDPAAVRSRDIAVELNEQEDSPYFENIKFPGAPLRKGGIALSTAVSSLKPLVEDKGTFEQIGIKEFHIQTGVVLNFFKALRLQYGDDWTSRKNAFQYAAGFTGAVHFLQLKVAPHCYKGNDYTVDRIASLIDLEPQGLIYQEEIKGVGGKDAPKIIYERLVDAFVPDVETTDTVKL